MTDAAPAATAAASTTQQSTAQSSNTSTAASGAAVAPAVTSAPLPSMTTTTGGISSLDPAPAAPFTLQLTRFSALPPLATNVQAALGQALQQAGIDASLVKCSYWEDTSVYPGGNFTNGYVTVQIGDTKCDFGAAATLQHPEITVSWMQHLMSTPVS